MLAFLHTSSLHVDTFESIARQLDDSIPLRHEVRAELLERALAAGTSADVVGSAVGGVVQELSGGGAKVILCTCSTIGALAEAAAPPACTVLRVDRPAALRALESGRRVLLVAALPTALEQTLNLLRQVALETRRPLDVIEVLCRRAWASFEHGDISGYVAAIAEVIRSTALPGDVVFLAQASMAPVEALITRSDIAVVSSPRLGVEAALAAYRGTD